MKNKIGYLCTYVPEEIIYAAGFSSMRIVPSTMPPTRADAHLQSYTCCLARSCLDQALAGKLNDLAGVVFAHTCDTLQGLADIWRESFPNLFVETVVGSVALNSPHAHAYLVAELRRFTAALEKHFNLRVTEDALRAGIRLYNARRRALADFYARRTEFSNVQWFNVMNMALATPLDEFAIRNSQVTIRSSQSVIRLVLVGATIDEPTLPHILDDLGAWIVADDFCNGARYFDTLVAEEGDPIEAIATRELTRATCPCKHRALDDRAERLLKLVKDNRADGVIFYHKKFCDPHAWDYPPLAAALDREKIPHLLLEVEQVAPIGQTRVRVEAFLEMLSDR
jgi:benzoyl-CoA reductase/2-hydroxyglutaryl-CoA dehydratase subunit BcrC/BadD/HgdB